MFFWMISGVLLLQPNGKSSTMAPALMSRTAVRPVAQMQKAKVQAPKPQKVNFAQAAAAAFTAVALLATPAFADGGDNVKAAVCAANPTAKLCLKNSAK